MRYGLLVSTLLQLASNIRQSSGKSSRELSADVVLAITDDISLHGSS